MTEQEKWEIVDSVTQSVQARHFRRMEENTVMDVLECSGLFDLIDAARRMERVLVDMGVATGGRR